MNLGTSLDKLEEKLVNGWESDLVKNPRGKVVSRRKREQAMRLIKQGKLIPIRKR